MLEEFILGREPIPLVPKSAHGKTFFSYGRTFYRAPTTRLYGRIHIDEANTFVMNESSFEGLFEMARICRVPLHTSSRSSIGSSMSSIEFYEAFKSDVLLPRNKSIPEAFKSAYELLVGDRGGFIYEPKVGIHDGVGEVDFSSMYPRLMVKNNISAETCREVSKEIDVPLNFEGRYKWIVFLPSKMHPNIGVLNRYFGVMENGKLKVRGLESP